MLSVIHSALNGHFLLEPLINDSIVVPVEKLAESFLFVPVCSPNPSEPRVLPSHGIPDLVKPNITDTMPKRLLSHPLFYRVSAKSKQSRGFYGGSTYEYSRFTSGRSNIL